MKLLIKLTFVFLIFAGLLIAKPNEKATTSDEYEYENLDSGTFDGYEDADFKLDYYLSYGSTAYDRFTYEFVVIDSTMLLVFNSPQTQNYNLIEFRKKIIASPATLKEFKKIVDKAGLRQIKKGVPLPKSPAYAREIIVVNYKSKQIDITGGITSSVAFDKSMTPEEMQAEMEKERKVSASVSGDIDSIRIFLEKQFPDLKRLIIEAAKAQKSKKPK